MSSLRGAKRRGNPDWRRVWIASPTARNDGWLQFASILLSLLILTAVAPAQAAEPTPFAIGYLELRDDARYAERRGYAGLRLWTAKRPYPGAEIALREAKIPGRAVGLRFGLERGDGADAAELAATLRAMRDKTGARFFLVDAPAPVLAELAEATRDDGVLLFNIAETDDTLRGESCRPNLMHVIPSRSMLTDAMAQYLAFRDWRRVLLLRGTSPKDAALATAFQASARKFGLRVAAIRDFVLSNDPRERAENNVALMTATPDYDVVFLADSDGEFGRYVPYQTARPRPVVGTEGLTAAAWHWSWERHGAPQLNQRFQRKAERDMQDADWAAWAAVKAIVEAAARGRSADFNVVAAYLKSDQLTLDAYKGTPASFRTWNNQLRQPILLHTHNATTARAPLDEFLHRRDALDTLGVDEPENKCRF